MVLVFVINNVESTIHLLWASTNLQLIDALRILLTIRKRKVKMPSSVTFHSLLLRQSQCLHQILTLSTVMQTEAQRFRSLYLRYNWRYVQLLLWYKCYGWTWREDSLTLCVVYCRRSVKSGFVKSRFYCQTAGNSTSRLFEHVLLTLFCKVWI